MGGGGGGPLQLLKTLALREGGAPLSAGQKQLVARARALLRHAKVRQQGRGLHGIVFERFR